MPSQLLSKIGVPAPLYCAALPPEISHAQQAPFARPGGLADTSAASWSVYLLVGHPAAGAEVRGGTTVGVIGGGTTVGVIEVRGATTVGVIEGRVGV